ncbi:hypothetical protein CYMTET_18020 [Cymbomonas tetramitiformis]|uniref:Uncharacterized protein n=1 Tax=Cymbomonas tetramitiformis TaxID=36881 RepID=A0AAE0L6K1_9CHLO|nr:hypothetical protein CYMTET_18020 [Cymbomonas tetramitiformis]
MLACTNGRTDGGTPYRPRQARQRADHLHEPLQWRRCSAGLRLGAQGSEYSGGVEHYRTTGLADVEVRAAQAPAVRSERHHLAGCAEPTDLADLSSRHYLCHRRSLVSVFRDHYSDTSFDAAGPM